MLCILPTQKDAASNLGRFTHPDQDTPQTAVALLRQLGLTHAPAQHQIDAIRTWLADHPPSPALRISLLTNGYGLLLRYRQ